MNKREADRLFAVLQTLWPARPLNPELPTLLVQGERDQAYIAGDAERAQQWQAMEAAVTAERRMRRAGLLSALESPPTGQALLALERWLHALPQAAWTPELAERGMSAEALVVFDAELAVSLPHHRKRAGHMPSKGRFAAAQLLAMLSDDIWLRNARAANAGAQAIAVQPRNRRAGDRPQQPGKDHAVVHRLVAALREDEGQWQEQLQLAHQVARQHALERQPPAVPRRHAQLHRALARRRGARPGTRRWLRCRIHWI